MALPKFAFFLFLFASATFLFAKTDKPIAVSDLLAVGS